MIEQVKVCGSTLGPRKLYGRWLLRCRHNNGFLIIARLIKGIGVPWEMVHACVQLQGSVLDIIR